MAIHSTSSGQVWHGYFAVEDINLSSIQRQELWAVLKARGQANSGPAPQFRNHWRFSLDVKKVIFEALFNKDQLTINQFKQWLGAIFNVDPTTINHNSISKTFDTLPTPIVTFSLSGINYIMFAAFGGTAATWLQSRREVLSYLSANKNEWEEDAL